MDDENSIFGLAGWLSDRDLVWDDDFDFSSEAFDELLQGRKVSVAENSSNRPILRGDRRRRRGGGPRRFKIVLRCLDAPLQVDITTAIDDEEVPYQVTLAVGQVTSITVAAERLVMLATSIPGPGLLAATLHYRLDYDTTPSSTWTVTQNLTSPAGSAEQALVPPPFAQSVEILWLTGQDPITLRYYEGATAVANKYAEVTLSLTSGAQPVGTRGPMTIVKGPSAEKYAAFWTCHG